tara:strand:+ start:279 stop:656 length:378 start_codon:yes stop_codon:yes gene_type:complete
MSTIKVGTLLAADGSTTTQPSIPALDQRMAKAWVDFNGTGTVAIRGSYNVSSITDNSTGNYSVNFATNMANTNYATVTNGARLNNQYISTHYGNQQVSKVIIVTYTINSTGGADTDTVAVTVFSS